MYGLQLTPMYQNCVNRSAINALGTAPIQQYRFPQIGVSFESFCKSLLVMLSPTGAFSIMASGSSD
jgi:hypothetical protein